MALRRRAKSPAGADAAQGGGSAAPPPPAKDPWPAEPGFAPVAVAEPPADEPGVWAAAAEPIDVTDATIDMPALAPVRGRHAARARSAVLTLAVVLACAGAAIAASGVLKANHDKTPPPVATGSSSAIATARPHAKRCLGWSRLSFGR